MNCKKHAKVFISVLINYLCFYKPTAMPEVSLVEVKNARDLDRFVRFPMELYKNNKNYVPPLINEEKNVWDPSQNPALAYSDTKKYLALKSGKIVGRIALIINRKEEKELGISKVRFGWLDFVDDTEVSEALINAAKDFAREHQIKKIEGPMGFTNLDKSGMLTMGFDKLATMIGLYNFEYYPQHLEKLGLVKEKEWVEFEMNFPTVLSEKIDRFSTLIAEKYNLKVVDFKNKKEILPYIDPMFRLLDQTYNTLSTYTPITEEQKQTYREKYFPYIDANYVICVTDENDELISFAVTMPSYSKALQK